MSLLSLTIFNEIDVSLTITLTMIGVGTAFTVLVSLIVFITIIQKYVDPLVYRGSNKQEVSSDKALAAAIGLSLILNEESTEHGDS